MEGRGLHALLEETRTSGAQHQRPLSPLGRPAHVSIVRQPPWRGDRQSRAPLVTSFHDKADEAGAPHPPHLSVDVRHTGIAHQTLPRPDGVDVVDGWAADGWLPESLTLGEPIGRGTFGVVRGAACNKTGRQYAVKVLKKRRYGYPAHLLRARIDNEVMSAVLQRRRRSLRCLRSPRFQVVQCGAMHRIPCHEPVSYASAIKLRSVKDWDSLLHLKAASPA